MIRIFGLHIMGQEEWDGYLARGEEERAALANARRCSSAQRAQIAALKERVEDLIEIVDERNAEIVKMEAHIERIERQLQEAYESERRYRTAEAGRVSPSVCRGQTAPSSEGAKGTEGSERTGNPSVSCADSSLCTREPERGESGAADA